MPWKVLGQKWHLSRKGFPPGKKIYWETEVLGGAVRTVGGGCSWRRNSSGTISRSSTFTSTPQHEAWAAIHTKRLSSVDLVLTGPKGRFAMGRIAALGTDREFDASSREFDVIKLRFCTASDLAAGDLSAFLKEHAATVSDADRSKTGRSRALVP